MNWNHKIACIKAIDVFGTDVPNDLLNSENVFWLVALSLNIQLCKSVNFPDSAAGGIL